jgi:hypothetical protein
MLKIFRGLKVGTAHAQRLMSLLTLVCGFFMMWGSSRGAQVNSANNQELRAKAVEIDPLIPDGRNNGKVVVAAGRFFTPDLLEDEFIKAASFLILKRHVEMYQWKERSLGPDRTPRYDTEWVEGQVDFFKFKETAGHENPLMRYEGFTRRAPISTFGAFNGEGLLKSVTQLMPLTLSADLLKDPSVQIVENKILIPRNSGNANPDTPEIGDMRVWYEVLPTGDYTVLTRQVDERNLVGASSGYAMVMRFGRLSPDELFEAENKATEKVSDGLLYVGGALFFIGLYSVLSPLAAHMDLRPKVNLQGAPALALVCAMVSAVAVVIFFIVGRVNS